MSLSDDQAINNSPFSTLIKGNKNLVSYFINIYHTEGQSVSTLVGKVLKRYLSHIRTDRSRLQIEFILINDDSVSYGDVPLPTVFTQLRVIYREAKNSSQKVKKTTIKNTFPAIKAIADNKHIVVVGDPGSGKTTLLNYIAILMANLVDEEVSLDIKQEMESRLNKDTELPEGKQEGWKDKYYFPISIPLIEFSISPEFSEGEGDSSNLTNFIVRKICKQYGNVSNETVIESIIELLRSGNAIILLDGLDHLPSPIGGAAHDNVARDRNRLKRILNSFTTTEGYKDNRVIVTSRRHAYNNDVEWRLGPRFSTAELQPFENDQIVQFINHWHKEIIAVERKKQGKKDEQIDKEEKKQQDIAVDKYIYDVLNTAYMRTLAQTPLLLTYIVCRYHPLRGVQSVNRLQLYDEIIKLLVERWARHAENDGGDNLANKLSLENDQELIKILSIVSFEAQTQSLHPDNHSTVITEKTLKNAWKKFITSEGREITIKEDSPVWQELKNRNGILLPAQTFLGEDGKEYERFEFPHQNLREALAAKVVFSETKEYFPDEWLTQYTDQSLELTVENLFISMLNHSWETWWVVCQLILEDAGEKGWSKLEKIITRLNPLDSTINTIWYGALISAEYIANFKKRSNHNIVNDIKRWLSIALQEQKADVAYRKLAGYYLSILGDPRFDTQNQETWSLKNANNTDSMWIHIPETEILVDKGSEKKTIVSSFYVSRYLITNDLFNQFITEGYLDKKYWTWSTDSVNAWNIAKNSINVNLSDLTNAPCVNVSWFEAIGFCNWLSDKLGFEVELPSELQWLSYSKHNNFVEFIDNDHYLSRFNIRSSSTTTVGVYPPTEIGLFDILGNAAEWTRAKWNNEVDIDEKLSTSLTGTDATRRVIRGASFKDWSAQMDKRESGKQSEGFYFVSFRIVTKG